MVTQIHQPAHLSVIELKTKPEFRSHRYFSTTQTRGNGNCNCSVITIQCSFRPIDCPFFILPRPCSGPICRTEWNRTQAYFSASPPIANSRTIASRG